MEKTLAERDQAELENKRTEAIRGAIAKAGITGEAAHDARARIVLDFGSAIKVLPGVGTFFGAGTLPLMAGAVTYATGRMFIAHFESGGTLIDFDAVALRSAFAAKLAEGKAVLRSL
jgi:hypothetical protein